MTKNIDIQNLKSLMRKYITEILIIFIGISISFMFDEWRDNRKDNETARKHLIMLKKSLSQDTFMLTGMIGMSHKYVRSINKLSYFKDPSEILDSINYHIDNAASYADFKANQVAYEEIKESAHTILFKDDTLKQSFLAYYTHYVPHCNEWSTVYKTVIMNELIPEMTNYFPIVDDKLNLITPKQKIDALREKKLRNILLQCAAYKQAVIMTYERTKTVATKLLKRIDLELGK
jgi:hypothetical protein